MTSCLRVLLEGEPQHNQDSMRTRLMVRHLPTAQRLWKAALRSFQTRTRLVLKFYRRAYHMIRDEAPWIFLPLNRYLTTDTLYGIMYLD
jgi:hypothetical protein